jgi:hypothetical protein
MEDAANLLAWRNDPLTRANSISRDLVSQFEHLQWLQRTLASPRRRLLIVEHNGTPAATARFDYEELTELNFCIAPEFRCRGLSVKIGKIVVAAEPKHVSFVLRSNTACQRLLSACGGVLLRDGEIQVWGKGLELTDLGSKRPSGVREAAPAYH